MGVTSCSRSVITVFIVLGAALATTTSPSFASTTATTQRGSKLLWDAPLSSVIPSSYRVFSYERSRGSAQAVQIAVVLDRSFMLPSTSSPQSICYVVKAEYAGNLSAFSNPVCTSAVVTPGPNVTPVVVTPDTSPAVPPVTDNPVTPPPSGTLTPVPSNTVPPGQPTNPITEPLMPSASPIASVPVPDTSDNDREFIGLNLGQASAAVIGLDMKRGGEVVTTYVKDVQGRDIAQESMPGSFSVAADYDGDGLAEPSTLERVERGYVWRVRHSSSNEETQLTIPTARRRIVSGCDFTGDRRDDLLFIPAQAPRSAVSVIAENGGTLTRTRFEIQTTGNGGADQSGVVSAASCFDVDSDGADDLVLVTSSKRSARARAVNSLLVINRSGEIVSTTRIRRAAVGIVPVPLTRGDAPVVGYYTRSSKGMTDKISLVLSPGDSASIKDLPIPRSRDIGSGVVRSAEKRTAGLLLYTADAMLMLLDTTKETDGTRIIADMKQVVGADTKTSRLATSPRAHFDVK